jgi:hypothetical protein
MHTHTHTHTSHTHTHTPHTHTIVTHTRHTHVTHTRARADRVPGAQVPGSGCARPGPARPRHAALRHRLQAHPGVGRVLRESSVEACDAAAGAGRGGGALRQAQGSRPSAPLAGATIVACKAAGHHHHQQQGCRRCLQSSWCRRAVAAALASPSCCGTHCAVRGASARPTTQQHAARSRPAALTHPPHSLARAHQPALTAANVTLVPSALKEV